MKIFPNGIELTDQQVACLLNDILNIEAWVTGAINGKLNNCKKRLIREWQPRLFDDPEVVTMPADESAFIDMVLARPDYKDRETRDREALEDR